jgi:hypothetical protein
LIKTPSSETLGQIFSRILERAKEGPITVRQFLDLIAEKSNFLVLSVVALPFCQPLVIPGLSVPFGLFIAFVGIQTIFGKGPILPKKILDREISQATLEKVAQKGAWLHGKIRRFSKPRLGFLLRIPLWYIVDGIVITLLGLLLALPLPIPGTNLIAAWGIFLISFGILEDDGLFVYAGYALVAGTVGLIWYGILKL